MRYRELFPDIPQKDDVRASATPKSYKNPGLTDVTVDAIINRPRPVQPSETEKARQRRIDDVNRARSLSKKLNLKPRDK
jgi:hypothetical protein